MFQKTLSSNINETYISVKTVLANKGCKILAEQSPKQIVVKQGSLWGTSPKTAKKTIEVNLESVDSGTKVTCYPRLSSDWKNLSIAGCVFGFVLVGLCLWMALDLGTFLTTHKHSFWSWIVIINGNIDFQIGQAFVNLTKTLAVFLSVIIILEIALIVYVRARLDLFAEETFKFILS